MTIVAALAVPRISAGQRAAAADSIPLMSITAGKFFTCGLNADGRAFCWGANDYAQLGTIGPADRCSATAISMNLVPCALHPVAVETDLTFLSIDAGARHVCGITSDSLAYCWGSNNKGQLATLVPLERCEAPLDFGTANDPCSHRPVPVFMGGNASPPHFSAISAGDVLSCALAPADASVWCWGTTSGSVPTRVNELAGARAISVSDAVCAIIAEGVRCFDYWSPMASVQYRYRPPQDFALAQPPSYLSNGRHSCAIAQSLGYCWGFNADGELGIGRSSDRQTIETPMPVVGAHEFQQLEAGFGATCGVTTAAELYCWGTMRGIPQPDRCSTGGDPFSSSNDCTLHPVPLMRGITVRSVTMGYLHYCALSTANVAYCWGINTHGELGNGTLRLGKRPDRVMGKPMSRVNALMLDLRDHTRDILVMLAVLGGVLGAWAWRRRRASRNSPR